MTKILGIIPSRYESSRFPGKALADIRGKSMIKRVYEQASKAQSLDRVIVATDDARIADEVESFGGEWVMTSQEHQSGTDRCFEAYSLSGESYDFVINVQGDEPFLKPGQIDDLSAVLNKEVELATLVKKITTTHGLFDPNSCKAVIDTNGNAIYFSRWPIPYLRDHGQEDWVRHHDFLEQVGVYAYRSDILEQITRLSLSSLEKAESLEQLRWMENGFKIKVGFTEYDSQCIDTPEDLERMLKLLESGSER